MKKLKLIFIDVKKGDIIKYPPNNKQMYKDLIRKKFNFERIKLNELFNEIFVHKEVKEGSLLKSENKEQNFNLKNFVSNYFIKSEISGLINESNNFYKLFSKNISEIKNIFNTNKNFAKNFDLHSSENFLISNKLTNSCKIEDVIFNYFYNLGKNEISKYSDTIYNCFSDKNILNNGIFKSLNYTKNVYHSEVKQDKNSVFLKNNSFFQSNNKIENFINEIKNIENSYIQEKHPAFSGNFKNFINETNQTNQSKSLTVPNYVYESGKNMYKEPIKIDFAEELNKHKNQIMEIMVLMQNREAVREYV